MLLSIHIYTSILLDSTGNINQTSKCNFFTLISRQKCKNANATFQIQCILRCRFANMHFHKAKFILFICAGVCLPLVIAQMFCSDLLKHNRTKFHPVRHCQRSNQTRIAARNVANLEKCIQFTEYHQGLAFNFGHGKRPRKKSDQNELLNLFDVMREKEIKKKNETKLAKNVTDSEKTIEPYFNCEVLSCPEVGNMSTMINDTRYDYYTLYGNGKFRR